MIPALLTAICFALTAVSAQQSASLIGPLRANFYRLLFAVIILGSLALLSWRGLPRSLLAEFALAGAIGFGLGGYCMMHALKRLGSPQALLVVESLTAILAGILAWTFLRDSLGGRQLAGCAVILAGVLFAGSGWMRECGSPSRMIARQGFVFALGAALFQAISLVLSRHAFLVAASSEVGVDKFNAALIRLVGGLLVAGIWMPLVAISTRRHSAAGSPVSKKLIQRGEALSRQPLAWITANALFGPVLGVTCWLWAVSLMNPGIVQSIAATAPLISIPVARYLESQKLGTRFFLGAPLAVIGIGILML